MKNINQPIAMISKATLIGLAYTELTQNITFQSIWDDHTHAIRQITDNDIIEWSDTQKAFNRNFNDQTLKLMFWRDRNGRRAGVAA